MAVYLGHCVASLQAQRHKEREACTKPGLRMRHRAVGSLHAAGGRHAGERDLKRTSFRAYTEGYSNQCRRLHACMARSKHTCEHKLGECRYGPH